MVPVLLSAVELCNLSHLSLSFLIYEMDTILDQWAVIEGSHKTQFLLELQKVPSQSSMA
jgi:hypothetical protein